MLLVHAFCLAQTVARGMTNRRRTVILGDKSTNAVLDPLSADAVSTRNAVLGIRGGLVTFLASLLYSRTNSSRSRTSSVSDKPARSPLDEVQVALLLFARLSGLGREAGLPLPKQGALAGCLSSALHFGITGLHFEEQTIPC
jgi:hypothetical protein